MKKSLKVFHKDKGAEFGLICNECNSELKATIDKNELPKTRCKCGLCFIAYKFSKEDPKGSYVVKLFGDYKEL